ncbi:MAG: hypothetical protein OER80_07465 [Gammaproteobacteria bacterium]|nr:hypothetical protein [Gammaproteobacteria bacterium]MDH3768651.1 hypothetical protein [Gammaproteobacteria bacterium]
MAEPDLYSPLLAFALINVGLAAVSLMAGAFKVDLLPGWPPLRATTLALFGAMLALLSHLLLRHRPDTSGSLSAYGFVLAHPTLFVTIALGLILLVVCVYRDVAKQHRNSVGK